MTISSSLNASVTGLGANASRLATISDNIANAGTYGYKRADTEFASLVVSSTAGGYSAGGVTISTRRDISAQGALVSSGKALDVAVVGRGMLPVTAVGALDGATTPELRLKPTGSFSTDQNGLLRTADGFALLGWPVGIDGVTALRPRDSAAGLEPVNVGSIQFAASPTTRIELGVNLPAQATRFDGTGDTLSIPVEYFDNVGASQSLTANFTPTVPAAGSSNTWTMTFDDAAGDPALNPVAEFSLTFSNATGSGGSLLTVTPIAGGSYDATTGAVTITTARGDIDVTVGPTDGLSALSQLAADFAPTRISKNGTAAGVLTGLEFDEGGYLLAIYDTGFRRPAFQVPLVSVPNPDGMEVQGGQTFSVTPQSGPFYLWDSGAGPAGTLTGFALEESTTDIAGELTSLIRTQRAYSSNAKVIQTVDEMLQETANIKR